MKIPNDVVSIAERINQMQKADLLSNSASAKALHAMENNSIARAAREFNRLQLPLTASHEIIAAYNRILEDQYQTIQRVLKQPTSIDQLQSLRDSITRQVVPSDLLNAGAYYRLKVEELALAPLIEAVSLKLEQPEFRAYTALQDILGAQSQNVAAIVKSIDTPWADLSDLLGSTVGVIESTTIFAAAHHADPYDYRVSEYLRFELGDYRDIVQWDDADVLEPESRNNLYAQHGLREEISQTPGEVLVEAERYNTSSSPATAISTPFSFEAIFTGYAPHLMAFQTIYVLERRLRDVINSEMTRVFGANWIKTHLREDIRNDWQAKLEKAKRYSDTEHAPIDFSDFTHYELIITGNAAWNEIFQPIFKRKEDVRESLQRLGGVRLTACHSRDVLPLDILMLTAEGTRLMSALAVVRT